MKFIITSYPRTGSTPVLKFIWDNLPPLSLHHKFGEIMDYREVKANKHIKDLPEIGIAGTHTMPKQQYLDQVIDRLNQSSGFVIKNFPRYHKIFNQDIISFDQTLQEKLSGTILGLYRQDVLDSCLSYVASVGSGVWNIETAQPHANSRRKQSKELYLAQDSFENYVHRLTEYLNNIEIWWNIIKIQKPAHITTYEDIFVKQDYSVLEKLLNTTINNPQFRTEKSASKQEKIQRIEFADKVQDLIFQFSKTSDIVTQDLTIDTDKISGL